MANRYLTRLRHSVQDALTAISPIGLIKRRSVEEAQPATGSPILAALANYASVAAAANAGRLDRDDGPNHPISVAYERMRDSGEPTTIAEVAAQLRFVMAFQGDRDFEDAALNVTPAERAAFYRANASRMYDDFPIIAQAIIALEAMSERPAPASADTAEWDAKFAIYSELRTFADGLAMGTPGEDDAVDAYCHAMDELIERTPAPNSAAFEIKMDLMHERWQQIGLMPREVWHSISADYRRLAREG